MEAALSQLRSQKLVIWHIYAYQYGMREVREVEVMRSCAGTWREETWRPTGRIRGETKAADVGVSRRQQEAARRTTNEQHEQDTTNVCCTTDHEAQQQGEGKDDEVQRGRRKKKAVYTKHSCNQSEGQYSSV